MKETRFKDTEVGRIFLQSAKLPLYKEKLRILAKILKEYEASKKSLRLYPENKRYS